GQADRWMVTPEISLPADEVATLIYKVMPMSPVYPDEYEILVSTTGSAVSDFTDAPVFTEIAPAIDDFTTRAISLEEYVGEEVYIAFRNISNDQLILAMKDFQVTVLDENDVHLTEINLNDYMGTDTDTPIGINIQNTGSNEVNSITVEWTDGEDTYTSQHSDLSLNTLESTDVTLDEPLHYETTGEREITVTVTEVNGEADSNPDNNELSKNVIVAGQVVPQKIVIEEGTGTWCQYCPRGFVAMDYMYDNPDLFPNFIGIGVHIGIAGYPDPMQVDEYASGTNISGLPGSNINRKILDYEVSQSAWVNIYNQLDGIVVPFELGLDIEFDKSSGDLTATVNTDFYTDLNTADYRLAVVVVEDAVTGSGPGWGQVNAYAGGGLGPMGGWENLPGTVFNYEFDRVGRALLGGYYGESGSVPASVSNGDSHSHEFTYTLPDNMNPQEISLVALLLDNSTGEILNAAEEPIPASMGVDKNSVDTFKLYPNPAENFVNVVFNEGIDQAVKMNIYNLNGRLVKSQDFNQINAADGVSINIDDLATGEYLISFSAGNRTMVKHLIVK
ncbi:MAG TPA: Omp28-related outer membrane protein, partial [Flavobacteriaceae bacterium]|nr:Omp28-related outer membrane protein [Flavobacteriaceae bacterium]